MLFGRIAIIESDRSLLSLMSQYIISDGYEVMTYSAPERFSAENGAPSLILLSRETAGEDLRGVIVRLKAMADVPVVLLSSRDDLRDRLYCFEVGADEVIIRPVSAAELSVRMQTVLRRRRTDEQRGINARCSSGGLTVDSQSYTVTVDGESVSFAPKEVELLFLLMSRSERAFRRDELIERVWNRAVYNERTVDVHINRIKSKIGRYAPCIKTLRGVGYKFTPYDDQC